jgi:phenylacetate-CoA ligase
MQEALIALRSWSRAQLREGETFARMRAEVEESQWYGPDAMARYRMLRLYGVLNHAATHCAFYRRYFDAMGFRAADVKAESEVTSLPLLDKDVVRQAGRSLLSACARKPLFEGGTSGTTGAPLRLVQDLPAINRENAFIWRQLGWAGLRSGDRRAWIRGEMVAPISQAEPPFWRHSRVENSLMLSSYHLSERNAASYLTALAKFAPVVIQAYPSSIGFLASWLEATGREYTGPGLKGIVTSSESLSDTQRAAVERRFGCKVFDWYGQFERVAAIGTCEHGTYHLMSDYSLSELVPAEGGLYEIVGTGFNNLAMPLIRYRTGDLVELALPGEKCGCGRCFPIVRRIFGRSDDVVKLPDGRHIGRLGPIFKGIDSVIEAQIRQDAPDRIDIVVVPGTTFGTQVEQILLRNARERLGHDVAINIVIADRIARSENGKFRRVVCNV